VKEGEAVAKQQSLTDGECPVARTLEAIGERWCMMIIREALTMSDASVNSKRISAWQKHSRLTPETVG
jgi:DNA-binding HxlR family transcriptional regulator